MHLNSKNEVVTCLNNPDVLLVQLNCRHQINGDNPHLLLDKLVQIKYLLIYVCVLYTCVYLTGNPYTGMTAAPLISMESYEDQDFRYYWIKKICTHLHGG